MTAYLTDNSRILMKDSYAAISLAGSAPAPSVTLWFKHRGYHALPAAVNLWNRARFRLLGFDDVNVQAWSHPLPKTQALLEEELSGRGQMFTDLTVALTVMVAMAFIPA